MPRPTDFQKDIARRLGLSLNGASSLTAAALIRDRVALAIYPDTEPRAPTDRQVRFATDLGVFRAEDSFEECRGKIQAELTRRNVRALKRLKLQPGDVVEYARTAYADDALVVRSRHVVSSIGKDLRVYFRDPRTESGGWPSQLTVVARAEPTRPLLPRKRLTRASSKARHA